ncbi:CLUMA_CG015311, isoform A [Clunio marinus]|uniref:CLUMA_CG015311, isoform A n=1 Tax=Clunio marinus TaxID=568069 RepID=A0A1J1INX3_9DIPT|nr:CLUMA_CG015311, isoform A [Clunio marinus]
MFQNVLLQILCVVFFIGLFGNINGEQKETSQAIDHPNKNEYSSTLVGSDKHKYGYELKENKHFHHTTTEEDGVRLGCYGYVLFGKKYSTQYVADDQGYRPVFTHDPITVYPKSGGERKASFVGDFNEDEQRSQNIRYFFPDGCKGSDINVLPMPPPFVFKETEIPVSPPKEETKLITEEAFPPINVVVPPFVPIEPPTTTPKPPPPPTTRPPPPPVVVTSAPLFTKVPASLISKNINQNCCCSDDDSIPKLVLKAPMKSLGKSSDSCEKYVKLIIPVEGLNPDSLKSLTKGSDTSEIIKSVLQSLS